MPKPKPLMRAERERDKLKTELTEAAHRAVQDRERIQALEGRLQVLRKDLGDLGRELQDADSLKADMANMKDALGVPRNTPMGAVLAIIELQRTLAKLRNQR